MTNNTVSGYGTNLGALLAPRCEIPVFKNESEARAYSMGVNSSIIGFDEKMQVVWIVRTGPNGEKTLCEPHYLGDIYVPEPEPDVRDLAKQISSIDSKITELSNRFEELIK